MDKTIKIDTFTRITRVSRETITSLKRYEDILIKANKSFNLIGNSTINDIWIRHFLDSAQVIDFIDKNEKILIDLGSGAGFPGLVISILSKDRKIPLKVKLIEKSSKKAKFLKEIIDEFELNAEVINESIFEYPKKLAGDVFVARAFKPLKIFLPLIHNKVENWKKIFFF
jgi:16S rRNA (guanine527-N7)-methyltransferase